MNKIFFIFFVTLLFVQNLSAQRRSQVLTPRQYAMFLVADSIVQTFKRYRPQEFTASNLSIKTLSARFAENEKLNKQDIESAIIMALGTLNRLMLKKATESGERWSSYLKKPLLENNKSSALFPTARL